jgi:hypothetical protein
MRCDKFVVDLSLVCKPYHTSSQKTTDLQQVNNKLITPHHRNQSTPEKTTDLWQVNNKLITPHHRKLDLWQVNKNLIKFSVMRCDKIFVDLSQVCDFLWWGVISLLLTCHRSVVFSGVLWFLWENYRPATSQQQTYHTSSQKTTDQWQVNNKLITPHHRKLQTCDKSTTNL